MTSLKSPYSSIPTESVTDPELINKSAKPYQAFAGRRWAAVLFILFCLVYFVVLWFDRVPALRGPADQSIQWSYYFQPKPIRASILLCLALGAAIVYLLGAPCQPPVTSADLGRRRLSTRAFLALATALGFAWWLSLLSLKPQGAVRALTEDTLSPTLTSYLNVAMRDRAASPLHYMRHHHHIILHYWAESLHASTHPPGPVLFYRAVYGFVLAVPGVAEAGARVSRYFSGSAWSDAAGHSDAALASALLAGSLVLAFGAATSWPLFRLGRGLGLSEASARRLALLWLLTPGPALMAPEFDQTLAFFIAWTAFAFLWAASAPDPRRVAARAALAGVFAALCLELSYGAAPFAAILALAAAAWSWTPRANGAPPRDRRLDFAFFGALAGFLLVFGVLYALGRRPVASFISGMINHRLCIGARDYELWLLFNPIEFLVFLGPPTALAGALTWAGHTICIEPAARALRRYKRAALIGLAALVASGSTPGEVGRIWIPLMPLALLIALGAAEPETDHDPDEQSAPSAATARWVGCALALLCVITRLRWNLP